MSLKCRSGYTCVASKLSILYSVKLQKDEKGKRCCQHKIDSYVTTLIRGQRAQAKNMILRRVKETVFLRSRSWSTKNKGSALSPNWVGEGMDVHDASCTFHISNLSRVLQLIQESPVQKVASPSHPFCKQRGHKHTRWPSITLPTVFPWISSFLERPSISPAALLDDS